MKISKIIFVFRNLKTKEPTTKIFIKYYSEENDKIQWMKHIYLFIYIVV